MYNIADNIKIILDILNDIKDNYNKTELLLRNVNDELCDLQHEIELGKPRDIQGGYKIYKILRDTEIKRRKIKDDLEKLELINNFLNDTVILDKLNVVYKEIKKIDKKQSERLYVPKSSLENILTMKKLDRIAKFNERMDKIIKNKQKRK